MNKIKQEAIKDFVRNVEPGMLCIHHEDLDEYAPSTESWKMRCDACRQRWPNDTLEATDGGAAGYAYGYNKLCEAVFSVKNKTTGYDAFRDCTLVLVSPCYTASSESDAIWDKEVEYWKNLSKLVNYKTNVEFCIREQFIRKDNGKQRITELSEVLRKKGGGQGIFVFSAQGSANLYWQGPLFYPLPAVMNEVNKGAEAIYFMCGGMFQEPQVVLNAEYAWNAQPEGPHQISSPLEYQKVSKDMVAKTLSEGGMLDRICRNIYGKEAGKYMASIYRMKTPPVCFGRYVLRKRDTVDYGWQPNLEATRETIGYVRSSLKAGDLKRETREILEHMLQLLLAGEMFADIRVDYRALRRLAGTEADAAKQMKSKMEEIEKKMDNMEKYINDNFTFNWATTKGGDIGYWKPTLDEMRKEMKKWMADVSAKASL